MKLKLIIATLFLNQLLAFTLSASQSMEKSSQKLNLTNHQIPHLNETINVDGIMDEEHWQNALQIALDIETSPADNISPPVKTIVYLYQDQQNLYLGFKSFDSNPEKIRAFYRDRDNIFGDDIVGIILDPSNLRNRGYEFFSNALGSQMDGTEDDLNKRETLSWDGIWDSAGQLNKEGYIVEMAIPFRLLRLPESDKPGKWGFELLRFYPRSFTHRISNNPRSRDLRCHFCQMSTLQGFEKVSSGNDIQLVPSLVSKHSKIRDLSLTTPTSDKTNNNELGLDLRWGINSNWTLNGTINPDFSQVEADAAQLSINTRFALFFPEKRSFFLEGADIFSSQTSLLHTRLIADPDWGIKLTGEKGNSNWGIFSVNDTETTVLLPGNQGSTLATIEEESINTTARFTHSFNNGLNLGAMLTNRDSDSYSNTVVSVDGRWDLNDKQQLSAQFMNSDSEYPELFSIEQQLGQTNFNDTAFKLAYDYQGESWFGSAEYQKFGKDFRADLGFVNRVDFDKKEVGLGYKWFADKNKWWNEFIISGNWDETFSESGELLERELEGGFRILGQWQSVISFNALTRKNLFNEILFDEDFVSLFIQARPIAGLRLELFTRIGDQIDFDNTRPAKNFFISPEINWNIGQHWLLELDHVYQSLDVTGGELFNVTLDDLRLTWQKDNRTFIRLTTQYQKINRNLELYIEPTDVERDEESVSFELLYSYKVNPQTLVFVGLNSGSRTLPNTRELKLESQLFFVKFSYSWLG